MRTDIDLQCLRQCFLRKRMRHMPYATAQKGAQNGLTADEVVVYLAHGIKARMEILSHRTGLQNADSGRQVGIQGSYPVLRAHAAGLRDIGMEHLSLRMHPASVRPDAAMRAGARRMRAIAASMIS